MALIFEVYDASSLLKSDMTPDDVQALIEKYQNMTRKQALKFARANLQLAGQGNKGLGLINTTTDKNLGEDGIGRVTVDTGQGSFEKAYLLIETALDFSTDLNVDMERKSSPMLIVFPVKIRLQVTQCRPCIFIPRTSVVSGTRTSLNSAFILTGRVGD